MSSQSGDTRASWASGFQYAYSFVTSPSVPSNVLENSGRPGSVGGTGRVVVLVVELVLDVVPVRAAVLVVVTGARGAHRNRRSTAPGVAAENVSRDPAQCRRPTPAPTTTVRSGTDAFATSALPTPMATVATRIIALDR